MKARKLGTKLLELSKDEDFEVLTTARDYDDMGFSFVELFDPEIKIRTEIEKDPEYEEGNFADVPDKFIEI